LVTKVEKNRAMEDALQAAVAKMSGTPALPGGGAPAAPSLDPIALLMTLLPKLLDRGAGDDDVGERLVSMQKEELQPLREQLARQQQLLERLFRAQKAVLHKLSAIETVQSAIGGAVTSLTEQMARIELVDDDPPEPPDFVTRNGHARSRLDFADLAKGYPPMREEQKRRARGG
jgi:hypothetical protein